jgi:hypothetical protein
MEVADAEAKDMPVIASVGVGVAYLSLARDGAEPAAELLGAADAVRGVGAVGDLEVQRLTTRLRRELGDAFDAAHARGSALGERTRSPVSGPPSPDDRPRVARSSATCGAPIGHLWRADRPLVARRSRHK